MKTKVFFMKTQLIECIPGKIAGVNLNHEFNV